MGADVHGPRWCIGHASSSAMLLVPDSKDIVTSHFVNVTTVSQVFVSTCKTFMQMSENGIRHRTLNTKSDL